MMETLLVHIICKFRKYRGRDGPYEANKFGKLVIFVFFGQKSTNLARSTQNLARHRRSLVTYMQ